MNLRSNHPKSSSAPAYTLTFIGYSIHQHSPGSCKPPLFLYPNACEGLPLDCRSVDSVRIRGEAQEQASTALAIVIIIGMYAAANDIIGSVLL